MSAPRVLSLESRRQPEMTSLIERFGGVPNVVHSMREIPLEENTSAFEFAAALLAGDIDFVLFMTGVGARALFETLQLRYPMAELQEALNRCQIMVRGPKPVPVLKEFDIHIDLRAPEPNTWREVLQELERAGVSAKGLRMAIQEYGATNTELVAELAARGALVRCVQIYRWALPEDVKPLEEAIRQTISGDVDVLLCTSAQQIVHLLEVASRLGLESEFRSAVGQCFIGSIGPTASERLRECGLHVSMEPSHPKMPQLVRESLQAFEQQRAGASR